MIELIRFQSHQLSELKRLDDFLKKGFSVLSVMVVSEGEKNFHEFVLYKADDTSAVPSNAQWDAIESIEGAETYSKSQGKYFHFWRCQLASGQKVNIFDHPDESRNTYKIAKSAGWNDVFPDPNISEWFDIPLPCRVSSDGEWLSLVDIMPYELYKEDFSAEPSNMPEWAKEAELEPYSLPDKTESFSEFISVLRGDDYLILDTETTDLDGEICEISIINAQGDVLLDTLVKPVGSISPKATKIHGITNEMVADAPNWLEVRKQVTRIIADKPLIIYNSHFDLKLMANSDNQNNVFASKATWLYIPKSVSCAMEAYAKHNGNWNDYHGNYRWVKLSDAAVIEGIKVENAHRALGDCKMTLEVCKALLKHYSMGGDDDD